MDKRTNEKLGKRLRILREEKGITQEDAARRMHWTQTHISQIENGRRELRLTDSITYSLGIATQPLSVFTEVGKVMHVDIWHSNGLKVPDFVSISQDRTY